MTNETKRRRELGEGKLGGIIALLVLGAFAYALFNVGPVYTTDYSLRDEVTQVARVGRGVADDDAIKERLMKIVKSLELDEYITKPMWKVTTRESSRRIMLDYERTVKVLPGYKRTFKFSHDIDEPFF
jgi:hypothetical protein